MEKTLEEILKEAKPIGWTNQGNINNVKFPGEEPQDKEKETEND